VHARGLAAAIAATASVALVMPGTAVAATTPMLGLSSGPGESPAAAIADAAQQAASSQFQDLYAGEVLTNDGSNVVVYLTQLQPSAEAAITAGTQPGVVSFALAPRSLAYLNALHAQVTSQEPALQQEGTNLVVWGPDFTTGREDITVQDLDPARTALLDRLFGAGNLVLTSTTEAYAAVAAADRADDTPPWNGGDYTIDKDPAHLFSEACTSGYGVAHRATQYLLTAGHCIYPGSDVVNQKPDAAHKRTMGVADTTGSYGGSGGIDAGLITTTKHGGSSKAVFSGGPNTSELADVSGRASSPKGDEVCVDGAFDGLKCGLVIQNAMPECIKESPTFGLNYGVCDVYQAKRPKGGIVMGDGDSGGPVFRYKNNLLYATGIVTAGGGKRVKCSTQFKGYNTRYCSSVLYYTSIGAALKELNVHLLT
jgi:Trypsin